MSRLPALRTTTALAALAAAGAVFVPSAMASGTVVYVRDHNVWAARMDGGEARRITTDGTAALPWRHPAVSDTGVIAAARDRELGWFDDRGTRVQTGALPAAPAGLVTDLDVDPSGGQAAVAYRQTGRDVVRVIGRAGPATGEWSGVVVPRWVPAPGGRSRVAAVRSDAPTLVVTDGGRLEDWLELPVVAAFDLARTGGRLVVAGTASEPGGEVPLDVLTQPEPPPATPDFSCARTLPPGSTDPSLSADGGILVWAGPQGLWSSPAPTSDGDCALTPTLIAPGGAAPDVGAQSLSDLPPTSPKPDATPSITTTTTTTTPPAAPAPGQTVVSLQPGPLRLAGVGTLRGMRVLVVHLRTRASVRVRVERSVRGRWLPVRTVTRTVGAGRTVIPLGRLVRGAYRSRVGVTPAEGAPVTSVHRFPVR